jgi:alpha-galactosidase
MAIIYHKNDNTFHLYNDKISYVFTILKNGQASNLYFGKKIHDREDFSHILNFGRRDMSPCQYEDNGFSMDYLNAEYPTSGTGDLRFTACEVENSDGANYADFRYVSHRIFDGKESLKNLPATYCEDESEAETLEIKFSDNVLNLDLFMTYTIFRDYPVIAQSKRFENHGDAVYLNKAMSLSLDLPDSEYEMIELCGTACRERHPVKISLHEGIQSIYSNRGHSSHEFNPFLALVRKNTDEENGEAIGLSLIYSGNFLMQAEVDNYAKTRLMAGINPQGFRWKLENDDTFQTPEAVLVYSNDGLGEMSRVFHKLYRTRLARGFWRDRQRPILVNNWEATYFNFDENKLISIATKAKELGLDMFVLDDGWFGHRNNARSSLGDWFVNREKLPSGIKGVSEKIHAMGLKFGLWFEPEMISVDSELYKKHPDWLMSIKDRNPLQGRNQFVLDFSDEKVVDYIAEMMEKILDECEIDYIKWDMNRSLSDVYSKTLPSDRQGEVYHKYILGVYSLYERLTQKYPEVLFESCASGGARFDPGMLYYAPQAWCSDNTDAIERIKIQWGTSMVYPVSMVGSHVSISPNEQMGRVTPIKTRADVAYFGSFGYELDLNNLSLEEQSEVKKQVVFMKSHSELIRTGDFYRLRSPFEKKNELDDAAWMVVSEDKTEALAAYYRISSSVNRRFEYLKFSGLNPDGRYTVKDTAYSLKDDGRIFYGDELMNIGLDISYSGNTATSDVPMGDYISRLFEIKEID